MLVYLLLFIIFDKQLDMGRKKLDVTHPPRKERIVPITLNPTIKEYLNKRRSLKNVATTKHIKNLIINDIQKNPQDYGIGI